MGSSPWQFHGMYFFSWHLGLALVLLLAGFHLWDRWCGLRLTDEVPSTLVGGDIDVCFSEELLQGRWSVPEDSSDEDAESLDPRLKSSIMATRPRRGCSSSWFENSSGTIGEFHRSSA
jgi:hypothetical protein